MDILRDSSSAYGPKPRLVLDEETEDSLLQSLRFLASDPSKVKALERWKVYSESYGDMIRQLIDATHHDPEVKKRIYQHIRVSNNLALDIANSICSVWKHANTSHVSVEGARQSQNSALRLLLEESGFYRHARSWNREAFLCGPVTAIPVVRGRRLHFDTLLPHFYSASDNVDDPWGAPLAAAWDITAGNAVSAFRQQIVGYGRDTAAVYLDGFAWRYFSRKNGQFNLVGLDEHGVGQFPGATLDFDISHGGSRWECDRHQRLIDATITIGGIEALLNFIRKSQNKQLLTVIGNLEGLAKGQTLDPEKPIVGTTQNPEALQLGVIDFDLDPTNHIRHESWIMQTIARSYGGQVTSRTGSDSSLEAEVAFSHEALTEQRNEQLPFAKDFMRDLLAKAVKTCIQQRHPLYLDLPDPEAVRTGLLVKTPPLSRSFSNVAEEITWQNHRLQRGLSRFEDLLRPSMPGASEEELRQHIEDNLAAQGPIITMMTTRDQSLSPRAESDGVPKSETHSARYGRDGPIVRDQAKAEGPED